MRVAQLGRVIIENDVRIGGNCAIDRGRPWGDTVIGAGTVLDNLVQIAHNVHIGRYCVIAGQVGIAGSSRSSDDRRAGTHCGQERRHPRRGGWRDHRRLSPPCRSANGTARRSPHRSSARRESRIDGALRSSLERAPRDVAPLLLRLAVARGRTVEVLHDLAVTASALRRAGPSCRAATPDACALPRRRNTAPTADTLPKPPRPCPATRARAQ